MLGAGWEFKDIVRVRCRAHSVRTLVQPHGICVTELKVLNKDARPTWHHADTLLNRNHIYVQNKRNTYKEDLYVK